MKRILAFTLAAALSAPAVFAQSPATTVGEELSELRKLEEPPIGGELAAQVSDTLGADQLAGADVFSSDGEDIGRITDIVFTATGDIEAAVVTVDGFLGFGRHTVAIPVGDLAVSTPTEPEGEVFVQLPLTEDEMRAMPEYQPAQ